jgi:nitrogen fixation protein FixH
MKPKAIRNSGNVWAWVPVMLLGSLLSGLGVMTYLALDDPHFALESNYYDKAVHWDRARAAARESNATGFSLELAPLLEASGVTEVSLTLRDRDGKPVQGAAVELEAFPNAYASRVARLSLREVAAGKYTAELRGAVLGLWELRVSATSGTAHFQQVLRRDLSKRGAV